VARYDRAISSGGERFLDAEEVSGSNPLSPTSESLLDTRKTAHKGKLLALARSFTTPLLHKRDAAPVLCISVASISCPQLLDGPVG
jgi:hypothetical protein